MRNTKRLLSFLWHYKQFSFAVIALLIATGLWLGGLKTASHWVLGSASIISLIPLVTGMWQDFRHGQWGLDVLALTAIVSAVLLHEYWAAIIVVIMLTGGESLEDYAERRAQSELQGLLERAPQHAHLLRGGKLVDIPASQVSVGDKLVVKPGEIVPVDGSILEGTGSFDESSLTGESLPKAYAVNDTVLSGSVSIDGAVTIKASHAAADSQYEQIIKLVRSASHNPAPFVRIADRFSIPFSVAAFSIAGVVWAISGDAMRFLQVIIVATPCPLLLAAPIALISGMSRASKYGIIIKTGSALEKLASIQTIALDKTGTLTKGQPTVSKVTTFAGFTQSDVLTAAASLEQTSNHVLAQAIVDAAAARKLSVGKAKHVNEVAGRGLKAHMKGKDVLVGRLTFLQDEGVELPAAFKEAAVTTTASYVAIDGTLAGVISFEDELRPETKQTLADIRKLGIDEFLILTGDNELAAKKVAKSLAIDNVTANTLPADKLRAVEQITARPVAFVGDGVNDAPVLTASDVGIALGARGSTAASESADVVIMADDFRYVARAIATSQRAFAIAKQSILIGIGISLLLMGLFATGRFSPVLGAVLQEVVDVVVIFNALRAHNIKVLES
jgi:heavy metal translocating P-type ATPase